MKKKHLCKLVLLFLLGVTTNASAQTFYWWHTANGHEDHAFTDWKNIDHNLVYQCAKEGCAKKGQVRMGDRYMYFEVLGDYHHVYINELKVKVHLRPEEYDAEKGYYFYSSALGTYYHRVKTYAHVCEIYDCGYKEYSGHEKKDWQVLNEGDILTMHSIREYIHQFSNYQIWNTSTKKWENQSETTYQHFNMAYWANITHSTSENYYNYLTNHPDELQRESKYFEVDKHLDGTYLLHPSWLCNNHKNYDDNIDTNEHVKHNQLNWHGEQTNVFEFDDTDHLTIDGSQRLGGYQEIELDLAGVYTVQAIVRGNAGRKVTLRLTGKNNAESTQEVYGMDDTSTSTVNTFGRVDYWDKGTNAGWTKVEASVEVAENGTLKIELYSDDNDSHFQVSDLTLLLNANNPDDPESFWTTAGLDENTTYMDMTEIRTIGWTDLHYNNQWLEIKFPYYNKFSFFDRGTNKNGVVYAHPRTVIGMYADMADAYDHVHECNIAVPHVNPNAEYNYADNALDFTDIRCKKLILSDNGTNNTSPHAFGIPMAIKAEEVSFERQYKAGQMSTAVFPFAMTAEQLNGFFGVEKVHTFKSIDVENQTLTFADKTSTNANEPFMFKPTKAGKIVITAPEGEFISVSNTLDKESGNPLSIATEGTSADGGTAIFQGIYSQKIWGADYIINEDNNPVYMFNAAKASGQFSILAGGREARCKPFRAYMEVIPGQSTSGKATAYKVIYVDDIDSEVTAINGIVDDATPKTKAIYTIDGRYVGNDVNRLERGLYIINGKKVIIK